MPEGSQSTIIRYNLFKKSGRPSPDGNRPNSLVGGFPEKGAGSNDLYQIYGNLLVDNPREALFQGCGRISFHDNVLIGGEPAAAVFRDHDLPLKLAEVFDNKIYSPHIGMSSAAPRDKVSRCSATSSSRKPDRGRRPQQRQYRIRAGPSG
jgi:hypothetical protein